MWDPERTYFFLHVMKTGGTSMLRHIVDNFPRGQAEPDLRVELEKSGQGTDPTYGSLERLASLPDERRREIRIFAGHYPFMATGLVPTEVTMTVLRDPVERTISLLRHTKRHERDKRDSSLEEIYEDPWIFPLLIRDYQAKLFALEPDDDPPDKAHFADLVVDDARLTTAKTNLARIDVLGLQHRFGEFLAELGSRYGWRIDRDHHRHAATEDSPVPRSLRRRIESDNQADVEFFSYATELQRARSTS